MTKKKLKKILDQVPVDYYESGVKNNPLQRYWHTRKWQHLEEMFIDISGKSLLDIGCADGTTTKQIKKILPSAEVTGVDLYKKAINHAKKRTNKIKIKFIYGDVHNLPFGDNSFEIVTAIETIEHLDNPNKALAEIYRVLKPNGYLIVGQDTDSLLFRVVWFVWTKWKGGVWKNSHISCMKPEELKKALKKQGFKIEKSKIVNLGMEIFIRTRKKELL